ncbi:hypothetical protein EXU57_09850 [Segetibacter sp. 3557_3]|uniref:DUF4397 domain-containing protein n=1 Tax=Segetibacter sp. 3557_3 TaxID=2547429 RepID=UPI001058752D|nr:DUF4397 domain-containing protein [Segetibacter sp. 3557_3]TDH26394.1 hypothetical protein EXU57_09850 [Segetibacter sp. 3557_3]
MRILIAAIIITLAFTACEKGDGYVDPSLPSVGAKVKFINTSFNAPGVIFYGKDTTFKFSAALVATGGILQGTAVGSTYPSNDYAVLQPYDDVLKVRVPTNATVSPGATIDVGRLSVTEGRNYSVFLVDSFPVLSTVVVNDSLVNFNQIADSSFRARFVNLVYGIPAGLSVDVYSKNQNAIIFSNVPYKGSTGFREMKVYSTQDEIELRLAGTPIVLAKLLQTPVQKRTYTWFARGRFGSTVTTTAPLITFYTNQ